MLQSTLRVAISALRLIVVAAIATPAPDALSQDAARRPTIFLPEFVAENPADAEIARRIVRAVADDLRKSGALRVVESSGDKAKANATVDGRVLKRPDGRIEVQTRLWDAASRTMLIGRQYAVEPTQWRLVADEISHSIHERLYRPPRSGEDDRE
jgi:TolB protein